MLAQFAGTAAGEYGGDFLLRIESLLAAKSLAIERGPHGSYQRMADELNGHSGIAVEFFFKGKNTESLREAAPDDAHAPGTPRPELRADVINVLNAAAFEFAGQAQVEAGEVREDCEGGLAAFGFADEAAHGAD